MKKLIALALAVLMLVSTACFVGCDPADNKANFKVGAIYINSKNDTAGYTYAHHNGITTAMTKLGLDPATQLFIVDEVPEDKEQVLAAVDTLVGKGVVYFGDDDIYELGVFRLESTAAVNEALTSIRAYIAEEKEALSSLASLYPSEELTERLWCYDHAKAERRGTLVYYFIMDAEALAAAERVIGDLK